MKKANVAPMRGIQTLLLLASGAWSATGTAGRSGEECSAAGGAVCDDPQLSSATGVSLLSLTAKVSKQEQQEATPYVRLLEKSEALREAATAGQEKERHRAGGLKFESRASRIGNARRKTARRSNQQQKSEEAGRAASSKATSGFQAQQLAWRAKKAGWMRAESRVRNLASRAATQAASAARTKMVAEISAWQQDHAAVKKAANVSQESFERFLAETESSTDSCSARLHQSGIMLAHIKSHVMKAEKKRDAHLEVIKSETENLNATDATIAEAQAVLDEQTHQCNEEKDEAIRLLAQYTHEVAELEQIADPEVRAEVGKEEETEEAEEETEEMMLLELHHQDRQKKNAKKRKMKPWSKEQCLAFVGWSSNRTGGAPTSGSWKHTSAGSKVKKENSEYQQQVRPDEEVSSEKRKPNAVSSFAQVEPSSSDCDADKILLQEKFIEAHEELVKLVMEVKEESEDTTCAETAQATYDVETADLVTEREHASDKIQEAQDALSASTPVLEQMTAQLSVIQVTINDLTEECTAANDVSQYLKNVQQLIISTIGCPGMDALTLGVPLGTYKKLKLTVTKARHPSAVDCPPRGCMQLGGFQIRNKGMVVSNLNYARAQAGPLAASMRGETANSMLNTNLRWAWVDHSIPDHPAYAEINLVEPTTFDSFRLGTASNDPDRDPIRWKLEGKTGEHPDEEWEVLYCQSTDLAPPMQRSQWQPWVDIKRDEKTGLPEAALRVCAA